MTGFPIEEGMTPDEVKASFKTMKRQQQEIAREIWEEKQKKKEEAEEKKQLIERREVPSLTPQEGKLPTQKEGVKGGEEIEEKVMPLPTQQEAIGIVPGVVTKDEKIQEAIKIEEREKTAQEVKRTSSIILVIIVMLVTIAFLIKSMYQGKPKDEKKKK